MFKGCGGSTTTPTTITTTTTTTTATTPSTCTDTCGNPSYKGDDWCDDENNNCGCEWDGGDCCGKKVKKNYCKKCKCLDPKA